MVKEDLKIGEIYYNRTFDQRYQYIFKYSGGVEIIFGYIGNDRNLRQWSGNNPKGNSFWNYDNLLENIREATAKEKLWYYACEKANKFIPLEDIKPKIIEIW